MIFKQLLLHDPPLLSAIAYILPFIIADGAARGSSLILGTAGATDLHHLSIFSFFYALAHRVLRLKIKVLVSASCHFQSQQDISPSLGMVVRCLFTEIVEIVVGVVLCLCSSEEHVSEFRQLPASFLACLAS